MPAARKSLPAVLLRPPKFGGRPRHAERSGSSMTAVVRPQLPPKRQNTIKMLITDSAAFDIVMPFRQARCPVTDVAIIRWRPQLDQREPEFNADETELSPGAEWGAAAAE